MCALYSLLLVLEFLDGDLNSVSATSSYRLFASRDSQTCMDTHVHEFICRSNSNSSAELSDMPFSAAT